MRVPVRAQVPSGHVADFCIMATAILLGGVMRLRVGIPKLGFANEEAGNVARAIAAGRGFADPFFPGQGPTAHLLPISPSIAGGLLRMFGQGSVGQSVLLGWSLAVTVSCYAAAAYCIHLLGATRRTAVVAFALLCLIPLHSFTEAVRWQMWDGGLGALLCLACLAIVLRGERGDTPAYFTGMKAAVPALTFIVNPITGLAAIAISTLSTVRHRRRDGVVGPLCLLLASVVVVQMPWVIRNAVMLQHPIVTRDNLGLELALANHAGAVHPDDPRTTYLARLRMIHPYGNQAPARAMIAAGGEVRYSRSLQDRTTAWMSAHPGAVAAIWSRHIGELLFPRPWMFSIENEGRGSERSVLAALVTVLAIMALVAAAIRRDWRFGYPAVVISMIVCAGAPFQPVPRYCWVIFPLLACLGADVVARLWRRVRPGAANRRAGAVPILLG